MSGSTFGKLFRVTTWGESHGGAIGTVVDGCPAGLCLAQEDIQRFLDRRKPGQSPYATKRQEGDQVEILSGIFEGKTTGTSISLLIPNKDQRSQDYGNLAYTYRPGHADFTFSQKYGIRDYRGGGRSSGRETAARVAAGAIASLMLRELGIELVSYAKSIGSVCVPNDQLCFGEINQNSLYMPSNKWAKQAEKYLQVLMKEKDSCGGVIECMVTGLPIGLGEPVFDKLDASLAKALMSIGAVKAVEIGDGVLAAASVGSENNDAFCAKNGGIYKQTNHSGGVLGGMSDGSTLLVRTSVKPTPSISRVQQTVTEKGEDTDLCIHGRHDPVIVPRAVVVTEAMTAITLADLLLENMSSRLDKVKTFYAEEPNAEQIDSL